MITDAPGLERPLSHQVKEEVQVRGQRSCRDFLGGLLYPCVGRRKEAGQPRLQGSAYRPDMLSELGSRQGPMFREEAGPELAGVGGEARLLEVRR